MKMWQRPTWELIWELARTDFKLRYTTTHLGYLWSVIKPLLSFLIINTVFSHFFHRNVEHYALQLLLGIILWNYFTETSNLGLNALVSKAKLVTRVAIPPVITIIAAAVHTSITFFLNLTILLAFFVYYSVTPTPAALLLLIALSLLTVMAATGIALALAPLNVRFRDTAPIWNVLLSIGFFATPIIYPFDSLPPKTQQLFWLNPMAHLIDAAKQAVVTNQFISTQELALITVSSVSLLAIGIVLFYTQRRHLLQYL